MQSVYLPVRREWRTITRTKLSYPKSIMAGMMEATKGYIRSCNGVVRTLLA